MDPKPPERIILDDSESERDGKSSEDKLPADEHEHRENVKSELTENEPSSDNKHDDHRDDKQSESVKDKQDDKPEVVQKIAAKSKAKELTPPVKSDEPTIVYAVKADENQRSVGFESSHRIPNIDEGQRKFETSHHIPDHIDNERTKAIENAKFEQKPLT